MMFPFVSAVMTASPMLERVTRNHSRCWCKASSGGDMATVSCFCSSYGACPSGVLLKPNVRHPGRVGFLQLRRGADVLWPSPAGSKKQGQGESTNCLGPGYRGYD